MNAAILVGIIAGVITVAGWFINHVLSARSERNRSRLTAELAHVERQLSELYGPLAFLVYEGQSTFYDLLDTLGRNYVFLEDQLLPAEDLKLWLFWVDHDLMPRNAAVQTLLSTKAHLIVGGDMPASYLAFLDHYNSWRVTHERWKEDGVEYSWHSKSNWPQEFGKEVITTFQDLMKRHADLIGAVSRA